MKKQFPAVFFLLIVLMSCAGCSAGPPAAQAPQPTENALPEATPESTVAPTPEPTAESTEVTTVAVSEHTLKSPVVHSLMIDQQWPYLIAAYQKNCTPLTPDANHIAHVSLDTTIIDWKIIYICPLNGRYGETTSYIDLFLESEYDAASNTLEIDCSPLKEDKCELWSFLIWATDESGNESYYYTRVAT